MQKMKKLFYFIMLSLLLTAMSGGCAGGDSGGETDDDTSVIFSGVTQVGGTSGTADTTSLTLTFSVDPATLTEDDITVTGAAKGTLTGTGITRTLAISGITVADGATVSVEVISPAGFVMSGSPRTAVVCRLLTIGMDYLGGKIAYFFVSGDTGYVPGETHGLIAAASDQASNLEWALAQDKIGTTNTDIGTGLTNTEAIVDQNDPSHSGLTTYAAGLCAAYNGGGYTDWYLPSRYELEKIFASKDLVGGYAVNSYWSSTECLAGDGAYGRQFWGGGIAFILFKYDRIHVRAVRNF
ncbi:MAG: DUF1566 domain-containing protein [Spirochaetes bacterium]|nr:MAG: DUF1566 domain-containing protein [Spirochaetota bacterium]